MKLDIQAQDHPQIIHHFCKAHPLTPRLEKQLLNNDLSLPPSQVQQSQQNTCLQNYVNILTNIFQLVSLT